MLGKNGKHAKNGSAPQGERNGAGADSFAAAITEVSERLTRLLHDEIELAKAEMAEKASSLARGAAAVAAGAVFGVFAVVFFLLTLAWVLDGIFVTGVGDIWLGFLIVLGVLLLLTVGAFLFAWRKLKVGVPAPTMAIDEAKKIAETVTARPVAGAAATTPVVNGIAHAAGAPGAAANGTPAASAGTPAASAGTPAASATQDDS